MNIRMMVFTILILAGLPALNTHADKLPQFGTHTRDQFQDYWYNHEINFTDEQRTLRIYFEKDFPYRIQKWQETYRGLIDNKAKVLTTRAVRTHTIMDPYWRHHTNKDRWRLEALGLKAREMGGN